MVQCVAGEGAVGEDGAQVADPVEGDSRGNRRAYTGVVAGCAPLVVLVQFGVPARVASRVGAGQAGHHAQVPAGASAGNCDALGVNAKFGGAGAEEAHRLLHIVQAARENRLVRVAVVDGCDRPAVLLQGAAHDGLPVRARSLGGHDVYFAQALICAEAPGAAVHPDEQGSGLNAAGLIAIGTLSSAGLFSNTGLLINIRILSSARGVKIVGEGLPRDGRFGPVARQGQIVEKPLGAVKTGAILVTHNALRGLRI